MYLYLFIYLKIISDSIKHNGISVLAGFMIYTQNIKIGTLSGSLV
jgi:hypothetical protein